MRSILSNPIYERGYLSKKSLHDSIKKFAPLITGKLLDLGCGSKPHKLLFKNVNYMGLDTENSAHNHIDSDADIYYDGNNLPFLDNSFDSVISFQVIEHVKDLDQTIKECKRILKINGKLLLTAPLIWPEHEQPYDFRRWTRVGLINYLNANGFRCIKVSSIGTAYDVIAELILDRLWDNCNYNNQWAIRFLKIGTGIVNSAALMLNKIDKTALSENRASYLNNIIICEPKN